ncbi:hypothetical protein NDU88_009994 [Pleurodeles waltl]|uniref:Uncharacterized protein n=1 Tax=Pleurodeles waltl TaxID=8319 RepID=A0AAV7PXI9_PLEWA|nr:hypothetical protein NDU88_009994 [Pleurodeles waltl]
MSTRYRACPLDVYGLVFGTTAGGCPFQTHWGSRFLALHPPVRAHFTPGTAERALSEVGVKRHTRLPFSSRGDKRLNAQSQEVQDWTCTFFCQRFIKKYHAYVRPTGVHILMLLAEYECSFSCGVQHWTCAFKFAGKTKHNTCTVHLLMSGQGWTLKFPCHTFRLQCTGSFRPQWRKYTYVTQRESTSSCRIQHWTALSRVMYKTHH